MPSKRVEKRAAYLRQSLAKKCITNEVEVKEIIDRIINKMVERDRTRKADFDVEKELNPKPKALPKPIQTIAAPVVIESAAEVATRKKELWDIEHKKKLAQSEEDLKTVLKGRS